MAKVDLKLAKKIHDCIMILQRRNRMARFDYIYPVDNDLLFLLMCLSRSQSLTPKDLSELLVLPKNIVSRKLIKLEELGVVLSLPSLKDKRSKEMVFTEKGQQVLTELIRIGSEIAERGINHLQGEARTFIAFFIDKLCDGLGFPYLARNPEEEFILTPLRRIALSSGMTGDEYMRSGLSLLQYRILFEIGANKKGMLFSEIVSRSPYSITMISRAITEFQKKGIIKKEIPKSDKRAVLCSFTSKGLSYFSEIDHNIAIRYRQALSNCPIKEAERFIELIYPLNHQPIPSAKKVSMVLEKANSEADYRQARKYLVEKLVASAKHENLGPELIPKTDYCYLYKSGVATKGILSINKKKNCVSNFALDVLSINAEPNTSEIDYFQKGLAQYLKEAGQKAVTISKELQDAYRLPAVFKL